MANWQAPITAALSYLTLNPGAVALIVGEGLIVAGKIGLHLTATEIYSAGAVVVPMLLAYFHVAKTVQIKAAVAATKTAVPGPVVASAARADTELAPAKPGPPVGFSAS